jgi:hypothetical protein
VRGVDRRRNRPPLQVPDLRLCGPEPPRIPAGAGQGHRVPRPSEGPIGSTSVTVRSARIMARR